MTDPKQIEPEAGKPPRVTVVTVYYNRAHVLDATIQSILAQSFEDFELIVVDDGSTDDTLERLKAYDDPRIRVLALQNGGFTHAVNAGIRLGRGEFVAIHGSGDVAYPDRLHEQVKVLAEKREVSVVGCHVECDSDLGDETFVMRSPAGVDLSTALLGRAALFTHGEVMFRRSTWDAVGGYREFFRFAQDRDMWLRMFELAGYDIVPQVLYYRRKLSDGVSTNIDKLVQQAYLSDFAVQCAKMRRTQGFDPLDRYGHLAPFFRHPSPELAMRLARHAALQMATADDPKKGWKLMRIAAREGLPLKGQLLKIVALTHKSNWIWNMLGKPALRKRLHYRTN